jgi:hypothetical protein
MKSKLILLALLVGGSAFAQTRFSFSIGTYPRGYYAAPPANYYGPARPNAYVYGTPGYGGAGYWGEDPDREHRRAEWHGLRNHQENERYMYGDSQELREHQALRSDTSFAMSSGTNGTATTTLATGRHIGSARDGWRH